MTPTIALELTINPLLKSLPDSMQSDEARAMMLAIGLQESRFKHRQQIGGPAKGFWQFEKGGGVRGVLNHHSTRDLAHSILTMLVLPDNEELVYRAIQCNDHLAAAFARLLLFTLPYPLPERDDVEGAWQQYIAAWRPGKPHRETWDAFWAEAWDAIDHQ